MANEDKKDFNAMLHDSKDMPKFQIIIDQKSIEKYGGNKMYFAPPIDYDKVMKKVPYGKVITVGKIREHFAKLSGADFTEPITAGIFVSIVAWASYQRSEDETPYWRTLKANGELNAKYPNGIEAQKEKKVWNIVLAVDKYNSWRSDLSKTEIINDKQFIEYTKNGYATTFTVTVAEPYKRWEFDMENSNMKGHWIGVFIDKGNETQIDFTENVIPKKWFMKPFVKTYLKKQQKQFVLDLKKALE